MFIFRNFTANIISHPMKFIYIFDFIYLFLGFASTYFGQKILHEHLPYSPKSYVLVSSLVAVIVSYKLMTNEAVNCQNGWMAMEEKHTALNPINGEEKFD